MVSPGPPAHVALVQILALLFKDFTVADAVHLLGMLGTIAKQTQPDVDDGEDRTGEDIVIGVCWILEKFASRARASGPECVSARARSSAWGSWLAHPW